MARRRYRRNEGLLELAFRSDWKFSAVLAAGCVFAAIVLIPSFFGRSPVLAPLGAMLVPLAWLLTLVFAGIAFVRFRKQPTPNTTRPSLRSAGNRDRRSAQEAVSTEPANPVDLETAWRRSPECKPQAPRPRPIAWSLDVLDQIEWKRFEDLCCAFYREKGIRAETTRLGADGGVDIRLFQDDADPTRPTAIVQCKAHNKPIGVKPVRELRGVMAHEKVDKAFFMASNGFTEDARAFAAENRVTLLDGKLFLVMLQRLPAQSGQRLLAFATDGDWTTPTCPSCGGRMTARDSKRGPFWGCVTYPKCRGMLPMRAKHAAALG